MRVSFDQDADAVYIRLQDDDPVRPVETVPVDDVPLGMINLDFGGDGRLFGIEILGARAVLPNRFLSEFGNRRAEPA